MNFDEAEPLMIDQVNSILPNDTQGVIRWMNDMVVELILRKIFDQDSDPNIQFSEEIRCKFQSFLVERVIGEELTECKESIDEINNLLGTSLTINEIRSEIDITPDYTLSNSRQYHFYDKLGANHFSVVFIPLHFDDLDEMIAGLTNEEERTFKAEFITTSMLALEQSLVEPIWGVELPDNINNNNADFTLNWIATATQSQGPGLGGPGSWPEEDSDSDDWDIPILLDSPYSARIPHVKIAILDSFEDLEHDTGRCDTTCTEVNTSLNEGYQLHEALAPHGPFVQRLIEIILDKNGIHYETALHSTELLSNDVTFNRHLALTSRGVGSVETVVRALHEVYLGHHFDANRTPISYTPGEYESYLVVNMSLNLFHTYPLNHPNFGLIGATDHVKNLLDKGTDVVPNIHHNRLFLRCYSEAERQRLPYALAIKAVIGWDAVEDVVVCDDNVDVIHDYYAPFNGNVVIVGAAGNENLVDSNRTIDQQPVSEFPARLHEVISVASTGIGGNGITYSNASSDGCEVFGGHVDYDIPQTIKDRLRLIRSEVTQPEDDNEMPAEIGSSIFAITEDGIGRWWSGSSFSTAIVSAAVAGYLYRDLNSADPDVRSNACMLAWQIGTALDNSGRP
ncbi:MAG: hypothetical protein CL607_21225 [Anaerolineaceae bacterium]|nr:hypothetical protein [Anaerolineaceae bacterium]